MRDPCKKEQSHKFKVVKKIYTLLTCLQWNIYSGFNLKYRQKTVTVKRQKVGVLMNVYVQRSCMSSQCQPNTSSTKKLMWNYDLVIVRKALSCFMRWYFTSYEPINWFHNNNKNFHSVRLNMITSRFRNQNITKKAEEKYNKGKQSKGIRKTSETLPKNLALISFCKVFTETLSQVSLSVHDLVEAAMNYHSPGEPW